MGKPTAEITDQVKQPAIPPIVEDEEMDEELLRPHSLPINRRKNAMEGDGTATFAGINKAPSVFEKGTLFDTSVK